MATPLRTPVRNGFGGNGFGRQTKMQSLCSQLHELAQQLGPDAKLPKMTELRDSLGASVATINTALGELEAQNVIYRKHGVGIYVSSKLHQRTIALVCDPSFFKGAGHSPFWDLMIERARSRAAAHDEDFSLHFTRPGKYGEVALQSGLMGEIESGRLSGVLGVGLTATSAQWLMSQAIPYVAFAGWARRMIALDGCELLRLGVAALAAQGCQRIALWRPISPARPIALDQPHLPAENAAFQAALKKHGLNFDERLTEDNRELLARGSHLAPGYVEIDQTHQEQGYQVACAVLCPKNKSARPDGIVITDDMMTHGALVAMRKLHLRAGKDVKIATSCNRDSQVLMGHEDELILIEHDPNLVVDKMFETLEDVMDGKAVREGVHLVKPRLRVS